MSRKSKTAATRMPVPQSREEADLTIARIGALQRERLAIEILTNERLAEVKAEGEERIKSLVAAIETYTAGLAIWCEAHRAELTDGGKVKTHRFPAGEISWRTRPASVRISDAAAVVERLVAAGLEKFLRRKPPTINRDAMLDAPEEAAAIEGVSIGSAGEVFSVEPFGVELQQPAAPAPAMQGDEVPA